MALKKGQVAPGVAAKSDRLHEGLLIRERVLTSILEKGSIPEGFVYHTGKGHLAAWDDPDEGIYGVSPGTLKKDRELFKRLWELCVKIQKLRGSKSILEPDAVSSDKAETLNAVRKRNAELTKQVGKLTDELQQQRTLYLDLLGELKGNDQIARLAQESIRAHYRRFGIKEAKAKS